MKIIIILLFILNVCVASAAENIYFAKIPPNINTADAISAVSKAALKRKWTVHNFENNILRVELNHRDYKALLNFTFPDGDIMYSDSTTYFNNGKDDFYEEGWVVRPVPKNWLFNLQSDVAAFFAVSQNSINIKKELSQENVGEKLEELKVLYDKKLITEADYELKKKEILSRY